MSDRKPSMTPIIVGIVIAILGILVGLYFADNARQQLAAGMSDDGTEAVSAALAAPPKPSVDQLPPLDPIVADVPPVVEDRAMPGDSCTVEGDTLLNAAIPAVADTTAAGMTEAPADPAAGTERKDSVQTAEPAVVSPATEEQAAE